MKDFGGDGQLFTILSMVMALTALVFVGMAVLMRIMRDRSKSEYNDQKNRAELSEMRIFFENKIDQLNSQLLATESRWKEVNHLLLSAQNYTHNKNEGARSGVVYSPFLDKMGVDYHNADKESGLVFVLTPFGSEFEQDFLTVKGTCESVGLRCVRGDEEHASGDILKHVLGLIAKADFIVANISSRNPNVYYELGIAQALGKETILISRSVDDLTFDLQSQRALIYRNLRELSEGLKSMILRTIISNRAKGKGAGVN